jgi:hypothetical protein
MHLAAGSLTTFFAERTPETSWILLRDHWRPWRLCAALRVSV